MRVLPLRLGKFGLRLNTQKKPSAGVWKASRLAGIPDGGAPTNMRLSGVTHYWGRSRTGKVRLKRKTSKRRLCRALVERNRWLHQERNVRKLPDLWQAVGHKMRGYFNYFGVTDNSRALYRFAWAVRRLLFTWRNCRSQRRSFTWESFRRYHRRYPLPQPGRLVSRNPDWRKTV